LSPHENSLRIDKACHDSFSQFDAIHLAIFSRLIADSETSSPALDNLCVEAVIVQMERSHGPIASVRALE